MSTYEDIQKDVDFEIADLNKIHPTEKDIIDILDEYNSEETALIDLIRSPTGLKILYSVIKLAALKELAGKVGKIPMIAKTYTSQDGSITMTIKRPDQEYVTTEDDIKAIVDAGLGHLLKVQKTKMEKDSAGAKYAKEHLKLKDKGSWKASVMSTENYLAQLDILKTVAEEKLNALEEDE